MLKARSTLAQYYHRLRRTWDYFVNESGLPGQALRGHYYSPLPDITSSVEASRKACKASPSHGLSGLMLSTESQFSILAKIADLYAEFPFKSDRVPRTRFHLDQGFFKEADSICLYGIMRLFKPQHVIEVGSGFSSALMLDVNDLFLDGKTEFTFIDPHPDRLELAIGGSHNSAIGEIIRQPVQEVPTALFQRLKANDILFIDSSHVSKCGSDVNHLLFEVLPAIAPGVIIHAHDVFWPFEYPPAWLAEGRAWNEAYMLRAFLSFNVNFEVLLWVPFAALHWRDFITQRIPQYLENPGASFWFKRLS